MKTDGAVLVRLIRALPGSIALADKPGCVTIKGPKSVVYNEDFQQVVRRYKQSILAELNEGER